ncbi:MAG: carbamoyl-phosphate synthase large subunit [Nitrospirota bacterium]|nr:carbamoyl-phosphate synthase large subunit [Nitrospirota bacterium]
MPKRTDIQTILLIGSGPIVIGQACEFDYSGTQALKALREEGYRVILVNSNPATIMTDPELADRTYIEPITPKVVARIIEAERPDALLPTMGGQTALNTAIALYEDGTLEKFGVELIGASYRAITVAEDRLKFKEVIEQLGLRVPHSGVARTMEEAWDVVAVTGFPAILRPSFTMGGTGGGIAYNREEFEPAMRRALEASPVHEALVEESVLGWKEYELEVMRDRKDNVTIICSIENIDPMGVHTGDSVTVAPAQTLTDAEYQKMRDASLAIIRAVGVDTGGSNIQFGINPEDGSMVVIEMNPRVSRSSALASKATGFPIAKIAAKLAIGYTLDEIPNDITRVTPASFEPSIDYVVVKHPRFAFEKFPKADPTLTSQMKSVGETMSIGRTFAEALGKALRSLEVDRPGLDSRIGTRDAESARSYTLERITTPNWERLWHLADAIRLGLTEAEIYRASRIDPWFIRQMVRIVAVEDAVRAAGDGLLTNADLLRRAKRMGLADSHLGHLSRSGEAAVRAARRKLKVLPVFKRVDTCAAEFEAHTPYLYSSYEEECESNPTDRDKVIILGGGPNRIGQGIEFDYCCVHGIMAAREEGLEAIMVNCNPETVSTDYDTSDRLYFEPLTLEDVMAIVDVERPRGVVVQYGGQTPLKLALGLEREGVPILGTSPDAIDRAEDRERFNQLVERLGLLQPPGGTATSEAEALVVAERIGYPVMVRPSYVLGGRAMEIVYAPDRLSDYMQRAVQASPEHPVLVDHYLGGAIEVDVDAVGDGAEVVVAGIMEHIEEAGVHSGDSACSLPPYSLPPDTVREIARQTRMIGKELGVIGLMNVQFAVQNGQVFIIEVNPRASRTSPFVSKATGTPWAKVAMRCMLGRSLAEQGVKEPPMERGALGHVAVKEAVFPFNKFPGVDPILGPEMLSTGEVMGIAADFPEAFAKAQEGAWSSLPEGGTAFLSVKDADKPLIVQVGRELAALGFAITATHGTCEALQKAGIEARRVNKVSEPRPHAQDLFKNGEIVFSINTVGDAQAQADSFWLRREAVSRKMSYFTTAAAGRAAVKAIAAMAKKGLSIRPLQDYFKK